MLNSIFLATAMLLMSPILNAAQIPTKDDIVVYLDCTGTRPIWARSFADRPEGMDNDKAKLVVRLDLAAKTATIEGLFDSDDFVFEIKSKPEWYFGTGKRSVQVLDGKVSSSNISLNRVNGRAHIGFEVVASPKDGNKWAFSGTCERGSVKF